MPVIRMYDPTPAYMFAVELGGDPIGVFTECDGLNSERDVVEYKEGGTNDFTYQFPGRAKPGRLKLRRGVTYPRLYEWFNQGIMTGQVRRYNISVKVLSRTENFKVIQRWDLLSCWPIKYEGPELKADSVQPALEALEIAYDGLLFSSDLT